MPRKNKKSRSSRSAEMEKVAPPATIETDQALVAKRAPRIEPRNHRELAEAIFAECDPVKVGRELLESSGDRGASVRARVFETLADWHFGKRDAPDGQTRVRIIWNIPGPPRERGEPE